ncbi:MAG: hypothetical protein WCA22_17970 [Candidatus Binatus sp.]
MAEKSRGAALTIFALLFALLALSDFLKPFHIFAGDGFVFLGTKLTGIPNAILGPLFGIFLLAFAYGIWAMRSYALQFAYIFLLWVMLNMALFAAKNHGTQPLAASLVPVIIGVGIPLATAIILRRRSADLA